MFFELIHSAQNKKKLSPLGVIHERVPRSVMQDRDSKNVVYYTVRKMKRTARDKSRMEQISNIHVDWDDFKKFSSLQLLGIICMRNDLQDLLHKKVFPADVLHKVPSTDSFKAPKTHQKKGGNLGTFLNKQQIK